MLILSETSLNFFEYSLAHRQGLWKVLPISRGQWWEGNALLMDIFENAPDEFKYL